VGAYEEEFEEEGGTISKVQIINIK